MKSNRLLPLLAATAALLGGCSTYQYRVLQPAGVPQPVRNQEITVAYDPLEYRLIRDKDRLVMRIYNPSNDRILLLGAKSSVIDARGQSRPLRDRIIAPHSYTGMALPPRPITVPNWGPGAAWGWGWGWTPYTPFYNPYLAEFNQAPVYYYEIRTAYDWHWHAGPVWVRLNFERDGTSFEHMFQIVREPQK